MSATTLISLGFATLTLSLLLPFIVRPILIKLGIVDIPNERSSHERPILRGLGLAVMLALVLLGGVQTFLFQAAGQGISALYLLVIGVFSFASGVLGFSEDLRGVSVTVRSFFLILIAGGASATIVALGSLYPGAMTRPGAPARYESAPQMLQLPDLPTWLLIVIAIYGVFFISGFINVANFMDGLNGISALNAIVSGLAFAATGIILDINWLAASGVLLAASYAGFLPWNLSKKGGFLGDVGSYLLGGSVSVISFAALATGVPLLAAIGPMVIYFGDVLVTLIKRVRAGHKWDEPHKEHVYQRLQQQGRSHLQVSFVVAGFSALTSLLGILSIFSVSPIAWLLYLAGGLVTLFIYLKLPKDNAR